MPDTNCLIARSSPEHATEMILQVRHVNSRYVVILRNFFKKYRGTIFVNTAHPCLSILTLTTMLTFANP